MIKVIYIILGCIAIICAGCGIGYLLGRAFSTGLMDGINHKFNKFTKLKEDGNKKETETK